MTAINVLVLHATDNDKPWSVETIDNEDYREINRLVRGNLGTCSLPLTMRRRGFFAFCDDDALVRDDTPAPNGWGVHLGHSRLRGPIVITRADEEGETLGLTDVDILWWAGYLLGPPSPEARRAAAQEEAWWHAHPSGIALTSLDSLEDLFPEE